MIIITRCLFSLVWIKFYSWRASNLTKARTRGRQRTKQRKYICSFELYVIAKEHGSWFQWKALVYSMLVVYQSFVPQCASLISGEDGSTKSFSLLLSCWWEDVTKTQCHTPSSGYDHIEQWSSENLLESYRELVNNREYTRDCRDRASLLSLGEC